MIGRVKLSDGREMMLRSTAATDIRYKQVFGVDCFEALCKVAAVLSECGDLAESIKAGKEPSAETTDKLLKLGQSGCLQVIQQIAYILNASANKRDMGMLNVVDYVNWLEDIEPFDLLVASTDIFSVYFGGKATESTIAEAAKKNNLSQMIGQ